MDKEFARAFSGLCRRHNEHEAWRDFVTMSAITISNSCNFRQDREDEYMRTVAKYNKEEIDIIVELFARTVMALEENPCQDFLGQMYMEYGFGSTRLGQYFTPYNVASLMATITDVGNTVENRGWASVNDPTCGSGVMLLASANNARLQGINIHNNILFVGQDLDYMIAMMCYIQISLLGCAGYVIVGNSLTEPATGNVLFAPQDSYKTPMYFNDVWHWRRLFNMVQGVA